MNRQDQIRNALKPLGNVVHTVTAFWGVSGDNPVPESACYPIVINADPDSCRDQIESQLRGAGLADIPIEIMRNPEYPQSAP
jgi:hypothetical protein